MLAFTSASVKAFRRQKVAGSSSGRARWRFEHAGRQHADHLVRLVVEQQRAAEHRPVAAEIQLPRRVAEHHDAIGAGLILVGAKGAAEQRLHPEDGEVIGRDVAGR